MIQIPNVNLWAKHGVQMLTTNAPSILTAFGAVGVVGTAILTGKASFEAAQIINTTKCERVERELRTAEKQAEITKLEKFQMIWVLYIPAVTTGVLSVAAIVLAHRVSTRRAAVLAAAYALNEGKLEEYQEKIKEKFGVKKEKEARDEIAQHRTARDVANGVMIYDPLEGKVIIRDEYSGRYFRTCTVEDINKAVNDINKEILISDSATLTDFYSLIGLEAVSTSDAFGWNTNERLEIDWSTTTTPDGQTPVMSFEFVNPPVMNPSSMSSFR